MFAVQVRLLAGRYVATEFNDRDWAEWPPHPMRLYAAAVAAWADSDQQDSDERAALEWWESLGPPEISCSAEYEVARRSVVTHYVPVNDATTLSRSADRYYDDLAKGDRIERRARTAAAALTAGRTAPESALQVLPDHRVRQGRSFPSVTPPNEVVLYTWPAANPTRELRAVVDAVLARIPRLGHSSSPVDVAVVEPSDVQPTYVPSSTTGDLVLRTVGEGQLAFLEDAFQSHRGREPRILASDSHYYRAPAGGRAAAVPHSVFESDGWTVLAPRSRRPIVAGLGLTRTLRAALMTHGSQPPSALISGHQEGPPGVATEPSQQPHLAFVALPFVGGGHGDGTIQALALVAPRTASTDDQAQVAAAVGRWLGSGGRLTLGRHGTETFEPVDPSELSVSARPSTWSRPSMGWSSVYPVALDRHPGRLDAADPARREAALAAIEVSVRAACTNVGLPEPAEVNVRTDAPIRGARPVRAYPPFAVRGRQLQRFLTHVDLSFDTPVRGPLIIGAGRYFGYGLLRPTDGAGRERR